MRVAPIVAASLFWIAASAAAQTDEIALYSDRGYTDCELVDQGAGQTYVYVVHHITGGAIASQFMVRESAGATLTYLGHKSDHELIIGDPPSGMAVAYRDCLYSDVLVTTLTYFRSGSSDACASLQVVADPSSTTQTIEVQDCFQYKLQASGSRLVINPDGSCACGPTTEDSNWGRIKDRFRD